MPRVSFDGERWSNADADRIELSEPDADWPARFATEAEHIREALDALPEVRHPTPRIEHIGSTAVPGIAAKPIIDILLVPPPGTDWSALIAPLESLDYVHWAENPRRDRMFFVKGMPPYGEARTHHVHVRQPEDARDVIRFRDHLIAHPEAAARYEALKRECARRHPTDRDAYTRAKGDFVRAVLEEAGAPPRRTPPDTEGDRP